MPSSFLAKRIAKFAFVPFVGAITPLLLLPVIARVTTVDGWASVALGQSIGAVAMIVVTFGWNLSGPSVAAQATPEGLRSVYRDALVSRVSTFLLVVPLEILVVTPLSAPGFGPVAALMAVAVSATGLSPAWYAIGLGDARTLLLYDGAPRVLAAVVSAPLLVVGADLIVYPVVLLACSLTATTLHAVRVLGPGGGGWPRDRFRLATLRRLAPDATSEMTAGSYSAGAVALVGLGTSTPQLAVFAAGDRLFRLSLYAISSASNALQGWVSETQPEDVRRARFRVSLQIHVTIALVGGLGTWLLAPPVSAVLFGPALAVDHLVAAGFGLAFLLTSIEASVGRHYLIPRGRRRLYLVAVSCAVTIGVPALVLLSREAGAVGGAWAVAVAEGVIAVVVVVFAVRVAREARRLPVPVPEGTSP